MRISLGAGQQNSLRNAIIIGIFLVIIGVCFIVFTSISTSRSNNWPTTEAIIVEIKEYPQGDTFVHDTFVDYVIEKKEYNHILLGSYEGGMKVGDIVSIKYNPIDPTNIIYNNPGFFTAFIIIGSCAITLGVGLGLGFGLYNVCKKKTKGEVGVVASNNFKDGTKVDYLKEEEVIMPSKQVNTNSVNGKSNYERHLRNQNKNNTK